MDLCRPRFIALALLAALITGCGSHPAPEEWDAKVQLFLDDYFRANPTFAVYQGKYEYDGTFPDWTAQSIAAEVARLHREKDSVTAFDTAGLDAARRFQRQYVLDPNVYVTRPYAPPADRMRAFTTYANNHRDVVAGGERLAQHVATERPGRAQDQEAGHGDVRAY